MARMLDDEFYNVQKNILDKVGNDSVDNDTIKGIVAMFGIDVFKRLVDRKDKVLSSNIEQLRTDETVRSGRNQELWKRRNKVIENDKLINEGGAGKFFDGQAENIFNDPKTHENSEMLKDNPDWVFNSDEFSDPSTPMYKVKKEWKDNYINEVLLPQHKNKHNQIDKNILTFDEYNGNNRELTKHAIEYAKRPEKRSILRQWNLVGKERTAKLKENYDSAKKETDNTRLEREGYLVHNRVPTLYSVDSKTGDTLGSTLEGTNRVKNNLIVKPLSGLTREMYATGEVYNEFEFRNTDNYKNLSLQGQQLATKLFKENEEYKDPNNSYELLNIFTSVQLLEEEQLKKTKYNSFKYNDAEFIAEKPKRKSNQTRVQYENSEPYQTWKIKVDNSYNGTAKNIKARQKAGYDISRSEEINLAVEDNLDFISTLREAKRLNNLPSTDKNYLSNDGFNLKVEEFKNNTISNILEKELGTTDKLQEFILAIQEKRMGKFLDSLTTPRGEELVEDWFTQENNIRKQNNRKLILPSEAKIIYTAIQTKTLIDDTAMMQSFLVLSPEGLIGLDPEKEKEYQISSDFTQ